MYVLLSYLFCLGNFDYDVIAFDCHDFADGSRAARCGSYNLKLRACLRFYERANRGCARKCLFAYREDVAGGQAVATDCFALFVDEFAETVVSLVLNYFGSSDKIEVAKFCVSGGRRSLSELDRKSVV